MNEDQLQRIDQYLRGQMPSEERTQFEEQLAVDDALRKEVELARQMNDFLSEEEVSSEIPDNEFVNEARTLIESDEAAAFKAALLKAEDDRASTGPTRPKRNTLLLAASITGLIILIGSFFFFGRNTPQKLFAQYYDQNDLPAFVARGDAASALKDGEVAFQDENYGTAIASFTTYLEEEADPDPNVFIYRGVSFMMSQRYDEAISDFDQMINSDHIDQARGLWFKALTHLKIGDEEKAIEALQTLASDPANFNAAEAETLLDKLK